MTHDRDSEPLTVDLTALVHDRPGVLARIANVFYRRGIDILTLDVGPSTLAEHARLHARVGTRLAEAERIAHALRNLVDVVSVELEPAVAASSDSDP
jgi:acetolactate synthase-1/3 small subunit